MNEIADRSSVGSIGSGSSVSVVDKGKKDPASILAAALAQRKNKVSQRGMVVERSRLTVDDEDNGEDW